MKRRQFLSGSAALLTHSLAASVGLEGFFIENSRGAVVALRSLQSAIASDEGTVLVPASPEFASANQAYNLRTLKTPLVRVLCATPKAVAIALQWARANDVPLALRSGGHSFEGFSQSTGLVIDTRLMNKLDLAPDRASFEAGAGLLLGNVYAELAKSGLAVPAGSCPTVGITGHTLGGGYGLLSRPLGLACDNLISAELVNARGELVTASETENADLFWALRGGGAGSFGVVTELRMKTHEVSNVHVYGLSWKVNAATAGQLMRAWQEWAPNASVQITSLMKVSREGSVFNVRAVGQSIGTDRVLRRELATLTAIATPSRYTSASVDFMRAVRHFGGKFAAKPAFMKGKSSYLTEVMDAAGTNLFLGQIPEGIEVAFDSYGGVIRDVKNTATAFAHREGTLSSLQYYADWETPAEGKVKMADLRRFHEAVRPLMSGGAYFNYCDLEIADYARAYWGENLERLSSIKKAYDPENFFRHAQSVPLKV